MTILFVLLALSATSGGSSNINADDDIELIQRTLGTDNSSQIRDIFVKLARSAGPTRVGSLLESRTSDKCTVPGEVEEPYRKSFNPKAIVIAALKHYGADVKIQEYNVVCLNQGRHKNRHSSASVIVKYSAKEQGESNATVRVEQIPVLCFDGRWMSAFFDTAPLVGTLSTATRHDCQMCPAPQMFPQNTAWVSVIECNWIYLIKRFCCCCCFVF